MSVGDQSHGFTVGYFLYAALRLPFQILKLQRVAYGFSGTSITSPSRSQKFGGDLGSEQSTVHSRIFPVAASRRLILTCNKSDDDSKVFDSSNTRQSMNGSPVSNLTSGS
jgi:hypothetical protein